MSSRHNIDDVRQSLPGDLTPVLRKIARFADQRISGRAIGTYMRNTGRTDAPNETDRLRIQSGRLSRAVQAGFGAAGGIGQREARTTVTVTAAVMEYVKEITVPYAAIHEFGGTIRVPVTARMRRFFWARFKATGDEKWKFMALTKKQRFEIRIPARPYLEPAFTDELPAIQKYAEDVLFREVRDG